MRTLLLVAALILIPVAATAQSPVVLPDASLATTGGNTNNNIPFSWKPTRYQPHIPRISGMISPHPSLSWYSSISIDLLQVQNNLS